MCDWVASQGKSYVYYVNSSRQHGFSLPVSSLRGKLVIAADFAITQEEVEYLVENNVVLLSTDHHGIQANYIHVKSATAEGIVINNQYPFEPPEDRYLSGAGVFYELICSLYPDFANPVRKALVGVTLLSDVREIENPKAKGYLKATYNSNTSNPYVSYLLSSLIQKDFGFGQPKLDRNFIDYTLSPTINALLRADMTSVAIKFVLGDGLSANEARANQKTLIAAMQERKKVYKTHSLAVLWVNASDFHDFTLDITGYIGLLCSDYKDKHKNISTVAMVISNGKVVRASFRGKYDDLPYRTSFRQLGIKAEGHSGAFGIKDFRPTNELWTDLSDVIYDLESDHKPTYKVITTTNLAGVLLSSGTKIAENNCYVRDMKRTYIKYTGKNVRITRTTFQFREQTPEEVVTRVKPDVTQRDGTKLMYVKDELGKPIVKFIEYSIDGRQVKSFGLSPEEGLILPILEKGYIQLYLRPQIE